MARTEMTIDDILKLKAAALYVVNKCQAIDYFHLFKILSERLSALKMGCINDLCILALHGILRHHDLGGLLALHAVGAIVGGQDSVISEDRAGPGKISAASVGL